MIDTFTGHTPVLVYFGDRHSTPGELCAECSDEDRALWVPVTFCPTAAANQLPEGAPNPNVVHLSPACTSCGSRQHMERYEDPGGSGWQCTAMDCLQMTVDGEYE